MTAHGTRGRRRDGAGRDPGAVGRKSNGVVVGLELRAARGAAEWSGPAGQDDGPNAPVTKSQAAKTKIGVAMT